MTAPRSALFDHELRRTDPAESRKTRLSPLAPSFFILTSKLTTQTSNLIQPSLLIGKTLRVFQPLLYKFLSHMQRRNPNPNLFSGFASKFFLKKV